jgi:hypothetical protein
MRTQYYGIDSLNYGNDSIAGGCQAGVLLMIPGLTYLALLLQVQLMTVRTGSLKNRSKSR